MALENMFNEIAVADKPLAVPSERIKIFEKRAGTFGEQFYQESGVKLDINETMALYDYLRDIIREIEGVTKASPNSILWRCENAMGESVIKQYKDIEDYDLIFGGSHASVIDHLEPAIFHEANPSIAEAFLEDCNNEIEKAIENAKSRGDEIRRYKQIKQLLPIKKQIKNYKITCIPVLLIGKTNILNAQQKNTESYLNKKKTLARP